VKTIAVIAEFNPLHHGHAWLLQQIRKVSQERCGIIIILPEFFSQRGVPNLLPPWTRTRTALEAGADLILSLPEIYALSSAEGFAAGAVKCLHSTGIVQQIVCGAENPNLNELQQISALLSNESSTYKKLLQVGIKAGMGFPAAREHAVSEITGDYKLASLLQKPNNILAIEYMKALDINGVSSYIKLRTIPRTNNISSSEIRQILTDLLLEDCQSTCFTQDPSRLRNLTYELEKKMPSYSLAKILAAIQDSSGPLLFDQLKYDVFFALGQHTIKSIAEIAHMQQGLGSRLLNIVSQPDIIDANLSHLIQVTASRSHPAARVRRAVISLLLGLTNSDLEELSEPNYIKVLGFNKTGRYLLRLMQKHSSLPIISLASEYARLDNILARRQAEISLTAAKLWLQSTNQNINRYYEQKPVLL
jgi:predicted nucleotidyltransferase